MTTTGGSLWVDVQAARNVESRHVVDAYCVVRLGGRRLGRSVTAPATTDPTWGFQTLTQLDGDGDPTEEKVEASAENEDENDADRLVVEVLNEQNFFFDMFPTQRASSNGSSSDGESDRASRSSVERSTGDEALGRVKISLSLLQKRAAHGTRVTDAWYMLEGVKSGEVRIRTMLYEPSDNDTIETVTAEAERLLDEEIYNQEMEDFYGFRVPPSGTSTWAHLRSYFDCREQRRIAEWEDAFGSQFFSVMSCRPPGSDYATVQRMARRGIPRHWRQRVYMAMSGATEKKESEASDYYASLVAQLASRDSVSFRQIELDIDRTFGHSHTKIATEAGRNVLRRVLKTYSMRNPAVGYCQGLNFIVGFLTLGVDEETAFWLLAVICEDLFPGYYIPTMADTQTDMLVIKQLIAEELPELDEFTSDVGLPLELLGSQWLLCLFTTTFPSETVFRIFDCLMTEGSYFVFDVIMAHLRRIAPRLVGLEDFQTVLSTMKEAENTLLDADELIRLAVQETDRITAERITSLREEHSVSVRDEMERADRARTLNRQLAVIYQIPAFSGTAANLLRFFHEEAEVSNRADVAFLLTLLCHGLVWLAEHSKHLRR
ncbi:hypothetical protein Poli38472_006243 [Pythium oligandrum]|uniref:Rab-GAP TBC domain-containing protein n=1 Tax=Pythium oligandrum TaxID=41045 RepID=A0A8K1FLZ0_PYTOL|nr:hypothetical protein Poli38472_006243 [Pythium oligandrum]|eukprot:TMW68775.1 hypothetical protein Poli38472_006243 [Pythium oligandrum]